MYKKGDRSLYQNSIKFHFFIASKAIDLSLDI